MIVKRLRIFLLAISSIAVFACKHEPIEPAKNPEMYFKDTFNPKKVSIYRYYGDDASKYDTLNCLLSYNSDNRLSDITIDMTRYQIYMGEKSHTYDYLYEFKFEYEYRSLFITKYLNSDIYETYTLKFLDDSYRFPVNCSIDQVQFSPGLRKTINYYYNELYYFDSIVFNDKVVQCVSTEEGLKRTGIYNNVEGHWDYVYMNHSPINRKLFMYDWYGTPVFDKWSIEDLLLFQFSGLFRTDQNLLDYSAKYIGGFEEVNYEVDEQKVLSYQSNWTGAGNVQVYYDY